MIDIINPHFTYTFQYYAPDGRLDWEWTQDNLIPTQGRDYIFSSALLGGSQFSTWYISIYSGSYTPQATDTAANYVANATEITTAYSETNRQTLTPDAPGSGSYVNSGTPAVFTFTADTTVRGGAIHSNSVKGGTTGILLSIVAAPSPKAVETGGQLKVIAGLSLAST